MVVANPSQYNKMVAFCIPWVRQPEVFQDGGGDAAQWLAVFPPTVLGNAAGSEGYTVCVSHTAGKVQSVA